MRRLFPIVAMVLCVATQVAADDVEYSLGNYMLSHVDNPALYLGFEPCADGLDNLEVEFGPQEQSWWDQVDDIESGKRMPITGGFIMKFSRPIADDEVCESSGRRNELPRCLTIDPDRVKLYLTLKGNIPYVDGEMVDCNDPATSDLSRLEFEEYIVPLNTSSYLGIADRTISYFGEPLKRACEYTIELRKGSITEEGRCLPETVVQRIWTVGDERTPFERETYDRRYDPNNYQLLAFKIKDDVTVYRDEVWERYGPDIGIGRHLGGPLNVNKMMPMEDAEGIASHAVPGDVSTYFQQMYGLLPVDGAGAVVREVNGLVKSVVGRVVGDLKLHFDWGSELSEAEAFNLAKDEVNATTYVWDHDPDNYDEPTGELIWFSVDGSMTPESFIGAWRFQITAYEPASMDLVYIDAFSGDPLTKVSMIQPGGYPEGFERDPRTWAFWKHVDSSGTTSYDGERNDFRVTQVNMGPPPDTTLIREDDDTFFYLLLDQGNPLIEVFRLPSQDPNRPLVIESVVDAEVAFKDHEKIVTEGGELGVDYELGYNVFDASDQTAEVSVYRSLHFVVEYLKELLGDGIAAGLFGPGRVEQISALVSDVALGPSAPLAAYLPRGLLSKTHPYLYFYKSKPGFNPGVTHDLIGHEFYHQLIQATHPYLPDSLYLSAPLEGFADVFGTLFEFFVRDKQQDSQIGPSDWCMAGETIQGGTCPIPIYDLRSGGYPNSFKSDAFETYVDACPDRSKCVAELTQVLTAYAFYLMVHGSGEGGTTIDGEAGFQLNDQGCFYKVEPIHSDPKIAMDTIGRLLWFVGTEYIGSKFDIHEARDTLISAAPIVQAVFSDRVPITDDMRLAETIADAFYAIGIGDRAEAESVYFSPALNKMDQEPWPGHFEWDIPIGSDWEIQVATDVGFTENVQTKNVDIFETRPEWSAQEFMRATPLVDLLPNERYFWRYRQLPNAEEWDNCATVRTFRTVSKAPRISKPQATPRLGGGETERIAFPWAAEIAGPPVAGATEYFIKVTESPDSSCEPEGGPHEAYDADTAENGFEATFELIAERDYYVYARAYGPEPDKLPGDCSNSGNGIKFHTRKASPPIQISPLGGDWSNRYGSGQTHYDWAAIQAANDYRLRIFRQAAAGGAGTLAREVLTGKVDEYTVTGDDITDSHTGYCWTIQAIGKEGDEGEESLEQCYDLAPDRPEIIGGVGPTVTSAISLAWTSEHAPFGYHVQVTDGSSDIFNDVVEETTLSLTNLNYSTTYTWHVWAREHDGSHSDATHATAQFTTEAEPEPEPEPESEEEGGCRDLSSVVPHVVSPRDGRDGAPICINSSTQFDWDTVSGADSYEVVVYLWRPLNIPPWVHQATLPPIYQSYTTPVLAAQHVPGGQNEYMWCVRARNECSESQQGCAAFLVVPTSWGGTICY